MKKAQCLFLFLALAFFSCKQKDNSPPKTFISVASLLKKEVEQIDTSLFVILRTTTVDSNHTDTSYIAREDFSKVAKDFLDLPDLADPKVASRFKEEEPRYDETMNRVIFTYLPVNVEQEEIKRQELLAKPVPEGESKVNSIYIVREISNRDSFFQQKMLWLTGRSFQLTTRTQKPGKPESVITTKVTWNEGSAQ